MKKIPGLLLALFLISFAANAQYYYKDILSNQQLLKTMAKYRENKVRTIQIKSFEDNGEPSEGFFCQKKISRDYRQVELFTRTEMAGASMFTSYFDKDGKLLSTNDSSDLSVSNIRYEYDAKNRISRIISVIRSHDDDFKTELLEEHVYTYNEQDQPVQMLRIKNRYDSTVFLFANDERNNVAIEKDTKTGNKYYYYYDAKNRLTDVVLSNELKPRLLPDYVFEYNSANDITQMTSTEEGGNNYFIWKYQYDNGLPSRERCYSKERKLLGSIEYEYK